ncbi:MAG TPA: hypothetical protein VGS28_02120 [Candidatus Saccharimonadales bacterium]|nr:hypothetical protein [Candidatus Saccharimonadales bacterium]
MNLGYSILLFFVALILDAVFALYTFSVTKHEPVKAGIYSAFIYLLSALGIVSFVNNKLYVIPLSLGAFLGAFLIVEKEKRDNKKDKTKK